MADPTYVPSGYPYLDELTGGFGPGQLILIAGRPAMGKTTFALNIAYNLFATHSVPVGFFSLEMNTTELIYKVISKDTRIDGRKITRGMLDSNEYTQVYGSIKKLNSKPLIVDEDSTLNINNLRMRARRMKELYKVEIIIIDYLQLLRGSARAENRNVEVGEISRGLKTLSKELSIPIIALAQLARKAEDHNIPKLSDLRESGSLEQDADKVIFEYIRVFRHMVELNRKLENLVDVCLSTSLRFF